ncbi:MAG: hypothetical protein QM578_24015 [Pantoea sp.]|uniref:hypothetical protein n=1 Tax=Pantoea sp. TaxID=69393 RepID=UPI0039E2630F
MSTDNEKNDLIESLSKLKAECDQKVVGGDGSTFANFSFKLGVFIAKIEGLDASILSYAVVGDLEYWISAAIKALATSDLSDDTPALNIVIGKLYYQFP